MRAKNIVFLTGAGISASSPGMQTFRYKDGLWNEHPVMEVCSPQALERDPRRVLDFYNTLRRKVHSIKPNPAHVALTKLQQDYPGQVSIITQNVDPLHEQSGSDVIHMHGELLKACCPISQEPIDWQGDIRLDEDLCDCCATPQQLRPWITFFEEMPKFMNQIEQLLANADLFVAIGTSGKVYPAAGFVYAAKSYGAHCIEVNLEPGDLCEEFHESRQGDATILVPELVEQLLGESEA
ncbi:NAD-dependent deacylase [Vibrio sp. WXL103]|uniref:NAD-dependent deacylase n=1 Tax=Vibrio sp. WXL103 TaxID=3450710 RepID=UPI003EC834B6